MVFKIPILDPLGLLSEPAEKLVKNLFGEEIEFHDPIRETVLDMITEDEDEEFTPHKKEYYEFGKRAITFSCSRCQAIAEMVAKEYAPGSPKKRLECMYYIKMFDESDVGTEGYEKAKGWLDDKGLKDVLYAAYVAEVGADNVSDHQKESGKIKLCDQLDDDMLRSFAQSVCGEKSPRNCVEAVYKIAHSRKEGEIDDEAFNKTVDRTLKQYGIVPKGDYAIMLKMRSPCMVDEILRICNYEPKCLDKFQKLAEAIDDPFMFQKELNNIQEMIPRQTK